MSSPSASALSVRNQHLCQYPLTQWPFYRPCWSAQVAMALEELSLGAKEERGFIERETHLLAMRVFLIMMPVVATLEASFSILTLAPSSLIRYGLGEKQAIKRELSHIAHLIATSIIAAISLPITFFNPLLCSLDPCAKGSVSNRHKQLDKLLEEEKERRQADFSSAVTRWPLASDSWAQRSIAAIVRLESRQEADSWVCRGLDQLAIRTMILATPIIAALEFLKVATLLVPKNLLRYAFKQPTQLGSDLKEMPRFLAIALLMTLLLPFSLVAPSAFFKRSASRATGTAAPLVTGSSLQVVALRDGAPSEGVVDSARLIGSHQQGGAGLSAVALPMDPLPSAARPQALQAPDQVGSLIHRQGVPLDATSLQLVSLSDTRQSEKDGQLLTGLRSYFEWRRSLGSQALAPGMALPRSGIAPRGLFLSVAPSHLGSFLQHPSAGVLDRALTAAHADTDAGKLKFHIGAELAELFTRALTQDPHLRDFVSRHCVLEVEQPLRPSAFRRVHPRHSPQEESTSLERLRVQKEQLGADSEAFLTFALKEAVSVLKEMESGGSYSQVREFFDGLQSLYPVGACPVRLTLEGTPEDQFLPYDGMIHLQGAALSDKVLKSHIKELARAAPHFAGMNFSFTPSTPLTSQGIIEALKELGSVQRVRWRTLQFHGWQGLDFAALEKVLALNRYVTTLDLTGCTGADDQALTRLKDNYRVQGPGIDENNFAAIDAVFAQQLQAIMSGDRHQISQKLFDLFQEKKPQSSGLALSYRQVRLAAGVMRRWNCLKEEVADDFLILLSRGFRTYYRSLRHIELNARALTLKGIESLKELEGITSLSLKGLRLGAKVDSSLEPVFSRLRSLRWDLTGIRGGELTFEGAQQVAQWMQESASRRGENPSYRLSYHDAALGTRALAKLEVQPAAAAPAAS